MTWGTFFLGLIGGIGWGLALTYRRLALRQQWLAERWEGLAKQFHDHIVTAAMADATTNPPEEEDDDDDGFEEALLAEAASGEVVTGIHTIAINLPPDEAFAQAAKYAAMLKAGGKASSLEVAQMTAMFGYTAELATAYRNELDGFLTSLGHTREVVSKGEYEVKKVFRPATDEDPKLGAAHGEEMEQEANPQGEETREGPPQDGEADRPPQV